MTYPNRSKNLPCQNSPIRPPVLIELRLVTKSQARPEARRVKIREPHFESELLAQRLPSRLVHSVRGDGVNAVVGFVNLDGVTVAQVETESNAAPADRNHAEQREQHRQTAPDRDGRPRAVGVSVQLARLSSQASDT